MLTTNPVPNLISGVSQQADSMKFPSQAVEQVNAVSHVVNGLTKRPPSAHVKRLISTAFDACKVHPIYRDVDRRYVAVFYDNTVAVFDILDGSQKTVNFGPSALAYLNTTTPEDTLEALSIADYTFVLNKTKVAALSATETDELATDSLVVVKQGDYGKTYTIKVGGTSFATYTTSTTDAVTLGTDYIAEQLRLSWVAGTHTGYGIRRSGSVLEITKTTGDYSITVEDGLYGNGLGVVKNEVRSFTALPTVAPHAFKVKIAGDPDSESDDYWVQFETPNGDDDPTEFTEGKWVESIGPDLAYIFDKATMPHVLVHEADGTFTFQQADWINRLVGDDDSSAPPSFIGKTITNMAFFRNRLTFLADENVILSESGNFFNFWRTTVTQLLDADPIDIAVSHNQVSLLYHAVPFFEQLILVGERAQFALKGGSEALTARNVAITPTTEFDVAIEATPRLAGRNLYFGFGRGDFTGMWEYFVSPDTTDTLDGSDITIGSPAYIRGGIKEIAVTEGEKTLFVRTDEDPSHLYTYKYFTNGGDRVQSAWSRWEFEDDAEIRGMAMFSNSLYLTVYRSGDGLSLERIDLQSGLRDENCDYTLLLDRKTSVPGSYNAALDKTYFYLPYNISDPTLVLAVTQFTGEEEETGGAIVEPESVGSDGVVTMDGDFSAESLWFGLNYTMTYTMSKPFLRMDTSSTRIRVGRRYQIRRGLVSYHNTLYFKVQVTPEFRAPFTYTFTGKLLGTPVEEVGSQTLVSGAFPFSVMTQNSQLEVSFINDLPFPSALTTVDWIGEFTPYGVSA